ncbi:MAG: diacylglycerol kinase catalytic region [Myxococcales bacterium]|nr:diacylglycerol kinase catalytic region [Myxococcales bacterium]
MAEARPGIAVFVNPRSRANKRNPRLAADFAVAVGDAGHVLAPESLEELAAIAAMLRETPPAIVAVHGGDGTLHRVVSALGAAFGDAPLPPIAVLPGGTMNVVASSLRIGRAPMLFLKELAEDVRAGRVPELLPRQCLRIADGTQDTLGFVFGNGLAANFLGAYYDADSYGPARAAWLLLRTFLSALVGGAFMRLIFKRFEGKVLVDGRELPRTRFVGVNAATVREVGLGFKLNHRADDDPERFGVLAIHAPPLALVGDLGAVHRGRGIAPSRAFSAVASTLEITPMPTSATSDGSAATGMSYTIDGDLYRTPAAAGLRISVGPAIRFVLPRGQAALPPRALSGTSGTGAVELPKAPAGDTMDAAR